MAKIKEEQLKKVTEQQQALTNLLARIGVLEIEKLNISSEVKKLEGEVEKTKKELEEEYGKVSINLADGTYEEIEDKKMHNIRKISIGTDYKNDAMHYAVGQQVYGGHEISHILFEDSDSSLETNKNKVVKK